MNADEVKPWVGVAGAAAAAALIAINKAIEANSNHKKSKQDPNYKRAKLEECFSKALSNQLRAGGAPAGSAKRRRCLVKAAKQIEMARLYAAQLDAEKEMQLIIALQGEIEVLRGEDD